MRVRTLVSLSILLLAFPLLAHDPQARVLTEPIGVLHLEGQPIEVFSWSWGATQTGTTIDGGGAGAGKVQMQDFHFTKTVDKSSASLFQACANGKHFPMATFTARKAGKGQQEYLVVKFNDLLVSSYQSSGSSGDAVPMETISLNFRSVEVQVP
jgi:type VI secretion system secreted protein Hcp